MTDSANLSLFNYFQDSDKTNDFLVSPAYEFINKTIIELKKQKSTQGYNSFNFVIYRNTENIYLYCYDLFYLNEEIEGNLNSFFYKKSDARNILETLADDNGLELTLLHQESKILKYRCRFDRNYNFTTYDDSIDLRKFFYDLYQKQIDTDFDLVCFETKKVYRIHGILLRSLKGSLFEILMKYDESKEKKARRIEIHTEESVIEKFIEFIYLGSKKFFNKYLDNKIDFNPLFIFAEANRIKEFSDTLLRLVDYQIEYPDEEVYENLKSFVEQYPRDQNLRKLTETYSVTDKTEKMILNSIRGTPEYKEYELENYIPEITTNLVEDRIVVDYPEFKIMFKIQYYPENVDPLEYDFVFEYNEEYHQEEIELFFNYLNLSRILVNFHNTNPVFNYVSKVENEYKFVREFGLLDYWKREGDYVIFTSSKHPSAKFYQYQKDNVKEYLYEGVEDTSLLDELRVFHPLSEKKKFEKRMKEKRNIINKIEKDFMKNFKFIPSEEGGIVIYEIVPDEYITFGLASRDETEHRTEEYEYSIPENTFFYNSYYHLRYLKSFLKNPNKFNYQEN